ncbi:S8 family peptidase [Desmospora profundinema]|uniref:Subtilisin family serine protease n=1 Tax=Desmospora profundinema TaxID=1571184 RepID=A0ABU1IMY2_9BACL|nr:S8 family serine peptidase [Desmospora profundinema]MDR6225145.1 subtilisin family serine protease [Desmospora profundinema]
MEENKHHNEKEIEPVSVLVEVRAKNDGNRMAAINATSIEDEVKIDIPSFKVDTKFKPIIMREQQKENGTMFITNDTDSPTLTIRGTIPKNKIEELKKQENVVDVFLNPKGAIAPMRDPVDCHPETPKGSLREVAEFLGADKIWGRGFKGDGIVIGIVDSGITAEGRADRNEWRKPFVKRVIDGFREDWGTYSDKRSLHGNMTATDALGMAPNANIYDIRIFSKEGIEETFLDIVVQAYDWAIEQFRRTGKPHILSNSWGFVGAFEGITDNPNHPVVRKVVEAVHAGMLVLFSAGNCGDPCFNPRGCKTGDHGPGKSIHSVNGHPLVMTVGAANIQGIRAGYSAQGPANFDPRKPDFCAPTHFTGYHNSDTGTSASCPIAAGVVALLRQAKPHLTQEQAKQVLMETATDLEETGWDTDTGAGMIQAHKAFNHLMHIREPIPSHDEPRVHPSRLAQDNISTDNETIYQP